MSAYWIIEYEHVPVSGSERTYGLLGSQQTYRLSANSDFVLMCDMWVFLIGP